MKLSYDASNEAKFKNTKNTKDPAGHEPLNEWVIFTLIGHWNKACLLKFLVPPTFVVLRNKHGCSGLCGDHWLN